MTKVVLWATGLVSQTLEYYLTHDSDCEIAGYTMDRAYIKDATFNGKPVVAFEEVEKVFPPSEYKMAIFISYIHLNKLREARYKMAKAKGYSFISYVHSRSLCDAAKIGENTFILAHNDIEPYSRIGNNVMIWSNNGIGHNSVIEDHCFLSSAKISSCVTVGHNSFLGTNVTVANSLEIGAYCVVGAGVTVTKSIKDGTVLAMRKPRALPLKSWEMEDILG